MSKKQIRTKPKVAALPADTNALKKLKISLGIIIGVFAFILYAQSISFDYTLDDHPAIDQNKVTTKGIAGIPTLLRTDYWYGFHEDVRGTIYRPTSLIIFATVWQFSPNSPHIYHFINVMLYALTCWILFHLLCKLFEKQNLLFPFVCALLYTAHPIHTEVVNNIKSLDEILCFLFGLLSILLLLRYLSTKSILPFIFGSITFFLSLISKETGITFLVIIPLFIFFFTDKSMKKIGTISFVLIALTGIWLIIRMLILKDIKQNIEISNSVLNNTLNAAPDFISKYFTIFYILLRYICLLIFPHPLTCDYNFAQIKIQTLSDPIALLGIIVYLGLGIFSLINFRNKSIIAFGILYFVITLAPVSNIFFLNGSTMAERFLYIPSLGFCIIVTYFLIKFMKAESVKNKFNNLSSFFSINSHLFILVFIITALYSIKTFSRSKDWKDNITIFRHDVQISDNSETAHNLWGRQILLELYPKEKDKTKQNILLDDCISEFTKARTIFDYDPSVYTSLGLAYQYKRDYINAIKNYEIALNMRIELNADQFYNLGTVYFEIGQFDKAINNFDSAIKYKPDYEEAYTNRGSAFSSLKRYQEAIMDFQKAIELNPKVAIIYKNIGSAYANMKEYSKAIEYLNKSIELDPADIDNYKFIGMIYQINGDNIKSKEYLEKANRMNGGQQR